MTFDSLNEILDAVDEKCLEENGQTLGLQVCGTKWCLAVTLDQVLWCDDDDPVEDYGELKKHLVKGLEDLKERIGLAIGVLTDG